MTSADLAGSSACEAESADDAITLYSSQAQVVLDTIRSEGISRVKLAYVERKYGDEAWVFKQAYAFFFQNASRILPPPEGAETAIWAYRDSKWTGGQPGSWMLKLRVPRECAVLFDLRVWNKVLNMSYVGKDAADEARFDDRLTSMGIQHPTQAFTTPFYPQVKQEIARSWQRLFSSAEGCPDTYLQAGLWELRREWVVDARKL